MTTTLYPEFSLLVNNLYAPAGTRIPMNQTAAPLGWTSDVSAGMTDCSMRVNSGSGGAQGGSTGWSGWNFGGTFGVNGFTISTAQLPAHSHVISDPGHTHGDFGHGHGTSDPSHAHADVGHSHGPAQGSFFFTGGGTGSGPTFPASSPNVFEPGTTATGNANITGAFTGVSVNTGFASLDTRGTGVTTTNTGSGSTIFPNYTTPQVKYTDHIMAVKS